LADYFPDDMQKGLQDKVGIYINDIPEMNFFEFYEHFEDVKQ